MANIEELKRLALAATQGDWKVELQFEGQEDEYFGQWQKVGEILMPAGEDEDIEYICAANPATILKLIAELEALRDGKTVPLLNLADGYYPPIEPESDHPNKQGCYAKD